MGYRSDVSYALEFRELSCKRKFVSVAKLDPVYGMALKECEHVDDDELYIWAKFDWVKWYDEYEDVSCHMNMLSHIADDELDGVSAKFVRIGEDLEDTEEMVFEGKDCPHAWDIKIGASRYIINDYIKEGE